MYKLITMTTLLQCLDLSGQVTNPLEYQWSTFKDTKPTIPSKLIYKVPMQNVVLDEDNRAFIYYIVNKKVIYEFLGSTYMEDNNE